MKRDGRKEKEEDLDLLSTYDHEVGSPQVQLLVEHRMQVREEGLRSLAVESENIVGKRISWDELSN